MNDHKRWCVCEVREERVVERNDDGHEVWEDIAFFEVVDRDNIPGGFPLEYDYEGKRHRVVASFDTEREARIELAELERQ